jgi:HEPN domain-containing protein
MKDNGDVAQDWLRKAESDFAAAELCFDRSAALDNACFHCQQAAEKSLKAWLIKHDEPFSFIHDLEQLIALCAVRESRFNELLDDGAALTPFAVTLRYDLEFWPSKNDVRTALEQARRVYRFVREHWS